MSKRINVNPDHYKVAGRERPGDGVARSPKAKAAGDSDPKAQKRWDKKQDERKEDEAK